MDSKMREKLNNFGLLFLIFTFILEIGASSSYSQENANNTNFDDMCIGLPKPAREYNDFLEMTSDISLDVNSSFILSESSIFGNLFPFDLLVVKMNDNYLYTKDSYLSVLSGRAYLNSLLAHHSELEIRDKEIIYLIYLDLFYATINESYGSSSNLLKNIRKDYILKSKYGFLLSNSKKIDLKMSILTMSCFFRCESFGESAYSILNSREYKACLSSYGKEGE